MKKIKDYLNDKLIALYVMMQNFAVEERGDTNFISIAIILVVVLAIAVVFIRFGRTITTKLGEAIRSVTDIL